MAIGIIEINHVNVVVAKSLEETTKHFYDSVLGLKEVPKPIESRGRGGAWYQLGSVQLHLSVRPDGNSNEVGKGHVCYTVADVESAEKSLRAAKVEIIPDEQPIAGNPRFYVRDPGGNLIEIAQKKD
ncbi:MAG TPA: VOC family protein [Pyrinomonadaceae bacterium]|jgi:catechol 2,3-dioxygenase-like lactoylglutathione lyase family enzyme